MVSSSKFQVRNPDLKLETRNLKLETTKMEAVAKTKYLKGSPRKARLVIDLIRGTNVSRALSILKFTDKRAADPIAQCLNSAIANAEDHAPQRPSIGTHGPSVRATRPSSGPCNQVAIRSAYRRSMTRYGFSLGATNGRPRPSTRANRTWAEIVV